MSLRSRSAGALAAAAFLAVAAVLIWSGGALGIDDWALLPDDGGGFDGTGLVAPASAGTLPLPQARRCRPPETDLVFPIRDGAFGRHPSLRSPPIPGVSQFARASRTEKGAGPWSSLAFRPAFSPRLSSC